MWLPGVTVPALPEVQVVPSLRSLEGTRARKSPPGADPPHPFARRLDRATWTFTTYRHDPADPDSLTSDTVQVIEEDGSGRLWLGTWDGGLGIEEQNHTKVFELFERLDAETEGTGIGLALISRIVKAHGGRIWVESAGRGRGSTFCFSLLCSPNQTAS